MILKVKVTENIWQYFDGVRECRKEIHYPETGELSGQHGKMLQEIGKICCRDDVFEFTHRSCSPDEADGGVVELWLYGKEKTDIRQVLCYRPAYLLSDEGKTVERF